MKINTYKLYSVGTKKENFIQLMFMPILHFFYFLDFVKASSVLYNIATEGIATEPRIRTRSGAKSEKTAVATPATTRTNVIDESQGFLRAAVC